MFTRILRAWRLAIVFVLIGGIASVIVSALQAPVFYTEAKLLVTYRQVVDDRPVTDAFTAARGATRLGTILAGIVHTDAFLDKALQTGFGLTEVVPADRHSQRAFWKRSVKATLVSDSNILTISARAESPETADMIVRAATFVLLTQADFFHGAGSLLKLVQVTEAIKPTTPTNRSLGRTFVTGMMVGIIVALGVILLREKVMEKVTARGQIPIRIPVVSDATPQEATHPPMRGRAEALPREYPSVGVETASRVSVPALVIDQVTARADFVPPADREATTLPDSSLTRSEGPSRATLFEKSLSRTRRPPTLLVDEAERKMSSVRDFAPPRIPEIPSAPAGGASFFPEREEPTPVAQGQKWVREESVSAEFTLRTVWHDLERFGLEQGIMVRDLAGQSEMV